MAFKSGKSGIITSSFARSLSFALCLTLGLSGIPLPARTQSPDKAVLKRQLPPNYALPKISDLLDEGKKLQRPDLPRPALKPSTLCGYHDKACKVKQAKEKKIGQNLKLSSDNNANQVAANIVQQPRRNWLSRAGRATARALFNASPVGFANALTAETSSFFASTPVSSVSLANNTAPVSAATANAASAAMLFTPPTYTSLDETRLDPRYRVGTSGEDMFSGNVNYSLPLVSLAGRAGLDVNITLSYNSLIWVKYNSRMQFDPSYYETLTPGFRLGFPEVEGPFGISTGSTCVVTLPSGKRVEMRQVGTTNEYQATDGSYLYLIFNATDPSQMTLYATDGTQFKFELPSGGYQSRCTQIKDSNGNYITISYKSIGDPDWPLIVTDKVTDTLGRQIIFNYDANLHLQTITQAWQGQTFIWAQFEYDVQAVNPNFGSLGIDGPRNNETIPVITRILTGDGARHTFVYNAWGQAEDFWLYGEANNPRAALDYVFPAVTGAQSDCPRPFQRNDYIVNWAGATGNGWVSNYFSYDSANETYGQMIDPSGVTHKEFFNTSNGKRGLTSRMETWYGGSIQKYSDVTWASDITTGRPLRPRVTDTQTCDDRNHDGSYSSGTDKLSRTAISYDTYASTVKLPGTVKQYNEGGQSVYRTTVTTYVSDANYTASTRRIIGLPILEKLYQGDSATLMAQTEYVYDSPTETGTTFLLTHSGQPSQHDSSTNGTAGNYGSNFIYRGNLTKARRYSVVSGSASAPIETKTGYYVTGTPALAKDALNYQTSIFYDDSFSGGVAPNPATYAYPTKVTDPDSYSSIAKYNYDFGAVTETVDPKSYAASPTNPPAKVVRTYDTKGRLDKSAVWKDGMEYSYTRNVYGMDHNYLQTLTTVNTLSEETSAIHLLDGLSRERITISDHPGSTGMLKSQYRVFDIMGRVVETSNATEVDGNWAPSGDDITGYIYSQQAYDWKGRPTITTNQDVTTKTMSYTGCGCAGEDTTTITDEGTVITNPNTGQPETKKRQQKVFRDAFGRVTKTQVLNWENGSPYSTMIKMYNVLNQTANIREFQGDSPSQDDGTTCPTGTCRKSVFGYDGYMRLASRRLPMESNDTAFTYEADDKPATITDARGAVATYSYAAYMNVPNNRRLVTGITYTGVGTAITKHFTYDFMGLRQRMEDDLGYTTYSRDSLDRVQSETRYFNDLQSSYTLSYLYEVSGQVKQMDFSSSVLSSDNFYLVYTHDKAGRMTAVNGTPVGNIGTFASNLQYRAWGGMKSMNYGLGGSESRSYTSRLRLQEFKAIGFEAPNGQYNPQTFNTLSWGQYSYNPDGSIKYAQEKLNGFFDRAYEYDHAGRLSVGYTGKEARYFTDPINNPPPSGPVPYWGPYKKTYSWNSWGDQTSDNERVWGIYGGANYAYQNDGRRTDWGYDAAGNIARDGDTTYDGVNDANNNYQYDLVGRNVAAQSIIAGTGCTLTNQQWYDGDDLIIKKSSVGGSTCTDLSERYFLRSSVLGGEIVASLSGQAVGTVPRGYKAGAYVYGTGRLLAEMEFIYGWYPQSNPQLRTGQSVYWTMENPVTGSKVKNSRYTGNLTGGSTVFTHVGNYFEPTPDGVDAGRTDPFFTVLDSGPDLPYYSSLNNSEIEFYINGFRSTQELASTMLANRWATIDPQHSDMNAVASLEYQGIFDV